MDTNNQNAEPIGLKMRHVNMPVEMNLIRFGTLGMKYRSEGEGREERSQLRSRRCARGEENKMQGAQMFVYDTGGSPVTSFTILFSENYATAHMAK